TSIHMIQSAIAKLMSLWPTRACDPLLAEQFERVFGREMEEVRDFLLLHYRESAGRDEPMWRALQAAEPPETLAYKLDQYRGSGRIMLAPEELFRDASWFAVLTGQGVHARDHTPLIDATPPEENLRQLAAIRAAIAGAARGLPAAEA
ncbi:MAG: tryptophan 7-halogenase, partial [Caulobacteraceae bacterium]|nr:tryptophan 7-halogenase [Caulobacter sp.]